jgi:hypothetical protein
MTMEQILAGVTVIEAAKAGLVVSAGGIVIYTLHQIGVIINEVEDIGRGA